MTKKSIERKFETIFKQYFTTEQLMPELIKIIDEYFQVYNQNEQTK